MTTYCPACLKETPDPRPTACPQCNERLFPVQPDLQSASERLSPLPHKSKIEIWQSTPERRIFHLRGGKGFPIVFGVVWLAFIAFVTGGMFSGAKVEGDVRVGAAILGLFWIVGFGLLYAGVRHRFLKTTILLERERLVIERNLFGWKSAEETSLVGVGAADLVVAYEQNYKPVFAVRVSGVERKVQFGAPLEMAEKNWLVDEINGFLAGRLPSATTVEDVDELRGVSDEELEARVALSGASIARPSSDALRLSCRALALPPAARVVVAIVCTGFAGVWYAGLSVFLPNVLTMPFPINIGFGLFMIPFLLGGLMPLGIAAAALWGEARLDVGLDEIVGRVGVGPFGFTRRLKSSDVDFVGADGGEDNPRWRSRPATTTATCVIRAGSKSIPLWMPSSPQACRALAELIRRRLPQLNA